jgi:thiol-disulfide isomerase/thioredoxin
MKSFIQLLGIFALFIGIFGLAIWSANRLQPSTEELAQITGTQTLLSDNADEIELPILGTLPSIEGINGWINSEALTNTDLEGKVVLVDFWTYSCINCIRTLPYITDWWSKYEDDGLVILGVHTPEFEFEKEYDNVVEAAAKYGIEFPIAQDNNYVTWRNFNNRYWPAKYLFDQDGNLRYYHFGEGSYDETELAIQSLLSIDEDVTTGKTVDFASIGSPETYFGSWRAERFVSPEGLVFIFPTDYSLPEEVALNEWALDGEWSVQDKYSEALEPGARFMFHYSAGVANLVMATEDGKLDDVVVRLDGEPVPDEYMGAHVVKDELTGGTFVQVEFSDLYELIDGEVGEHVLEIEALEPGLQIYAITFGS